MGVHLTRGRRLGIARVGNGGVGGVGGGARKWVQRIPGVGKRRE